MKLNTSSQELAKKQALAKESKKKKIDMIKQRQQEQFLNAKSPRGVKPRDGEEIKFPTFVFAAPTHSPHSGKEKKTSGTASQK